MKPYQWTRKQKGQAIVEGTAFLMLFLPLLIALALLTLYIGISSYYHVVMAQVADAGARAAINDAYWMGALRPNYDANSESTKINTVVSNIWKNIGLPGTISATVLAEPSVDPNNVTVTVSVKGAAIPTGGFIPQSLSLRATAVEPYNIDLPIGTCGMSIININNGGYQGIVMPAYGASSADGKIYQIPLDGNFPYRNIGSLVPKNVPNWSANMTTSGTYGPNGAPLGGPYAGPTGVPNTPPTF